MADEMINSTKPFNKSSGTQGIGDTINLMNEHDMNVLNDSISQSGKEQGKTNVGRYSKNS